MSHFAAILFFTLSVALAIWIGCLGAALIEETALGWLFFGIGVGTPPALVLGQRGGREKGG